MGRAQTQIKLATNRLELFRQVLADVERLAVTESTGRPSKSAIVQMRYLVELESGLRNDFERLADINIGLLTVRELQPSDPAIENRLYQVDAEAHSGTGSEAQFLTGQWPRHLLTLV